ncbi:MAG: DsbA family protein [Blastocatellia bacterium]
MIGEVSLKKAIAATGAEAVFRAYQLRVSGPPKFDPASESFAELFRTRVQPLAAQFGVEMRRPSRLPLTRMAHEAAAWARTQGRFNAYHDALFRALYIADRDFSDIEVLKQIARNLGLNAAALETALQQGLMAEDVDDDLLVAQTYGVRGVPAYVSNGQLLFGVQAPEALIAFIENAARLGQLAANAGDDPAMSTPGARPVPIQISR